MLVFDEPVLVRLTNLNPSKLISDGVGLYSSIKSSLVLPPAIWTSEITAWLVADRAG